MKPTYRLGIERTGLRDIFQILERQTGLVVPHCQSPVVGTREQHALAVQAEGIDDRFMADEVVDKDTLGAFPLFDTDAVSLVDSEWVHSNSLVASATGTRKAVFGRVDCERSHGLFVVCQGGHALSSRQIP